MAKSRLNADDRASAYVTMVDINEAMGKEAVAELGGYFAAHQLYSQRLTEADLAILNSSNATLPTSMSRFKLSRQPCRTHHRKAVIS